MVVYTSGGWVAPALAVQGEGGEGPPALWQGGWVAIHSRRRVVLLLRPLAWRLGGGRGTARGYQWEGQESREGGGGSRMEGPRALYIDGSTATTYIFFPEFCAKKVLDGPQEKSMKSMGGCGFLPYGIPGIH